jgi:hypothetical protein
MLREGKPDMVIAFPGGNGTWYTCSQAEEARDPCYATSSLRVIAWREAARSGGLRDVCSWRSMHIGG